jgi:transcriptional regulator with XRE-family HTH domain
MLLSACELKGLLKTWACKRGNQTLPETSFGVWLKEKRGERRLSQGKLSDLTGISKGYLGHLEQFDKPPSQDKCRALAKALMVSEIEVMQVAGYYPRGQEAAGVLTPDELEFIREFRLVDHELRALVTDIIKRANNEEMSVTVETVDTAT